MGWLTHRRARTSDCAPTAALAAGTARPYVQANPAHGAKAWAKGAGSLMGKRPNDRSNARP